MDAPRNIILVPTANFPALEEYCDGMDVTRVEVYGYPGFGFFDVATVHATVEFLLSRGMIFRLLSDQTPNLPNQTPLNSPASSSGESGSARRSPEGAEA